MGLHAIDEWCRNANKLLGSQQLESYLIQSLCARSSAAKRVTKRTVPFIDQAPRLFSSLVLGWMANELGERPQFDGLVWSLE